MTPAEIEQIKSALESHLFSDEEWINDCIDHIASMIENNHESILFEDKLDQALKIFSIEEMKTIEIEIIKQKQMKNSKTLNAGINYSIIIAISMMTIGMIIKLIHGTGAMAFILGAIIISCIIVFPLLLVKILQSSMVILGKWVDVLMLVSVLTFISGTLFKIAKWPGATMLMLFGIGTFTLFFWPLSLKYQWNKQEEKWRVLMNHLLMLIVAMMIFGLFKV
jgi:hypothetical protein